MAQLIQLNQLAKRFGPVRAVDGVTFAVARGEVLGFLRPNGAGRSTTMRMLTSYLAPLAGSAVVMGCDVVEAPIEARCHIACLP
ncbi:MAG: ATP-binding cassette domain-containing protein [Geminicoccaceae bacterium]